MRGEGAAEVDRLAAGADECQLRDHGRCARAGHRCRRNVYRCRLLPRRRGAQRQGADGGEAGGVGGRCRARGRRDCVDRFTHGTTVATNALLERKGARTAFVTNDGFEHLLHLRRQNRAHLYRPVRGASRAARAARALRRRPRADRPGGRARAARARLAARARCGCSGDLPAPRATGTRRTSARSRRRCGGACRARTSSPRTRSHPSSASTSAPRRPRSTPTSGRSSRATCARSPGDAWMRGCRSRS